jgi:hypothetical protein
MFVCFSGVREKVIPHRVWCSENHSFRALDFRLVRIEKVASVQKIESPCLAIVVSPILF